MKKIACLATVQERQSSLLQTIASIYNQVDEVHVYLNDYERKPAILYVKVFNNFKNVKLHFGPELAGDLGDAAKFYFIDKLPECYYFTLDDDLFYPQNYVKKHLEFQEYFNNEIITTYHGRSLFKFPLKGFYHPELSSDVKCLRESKYPQFTQFGGTGVMCIPTHKIKLALNDFGAERNMADVWVGIYSQRNNIPILTLPHAQGEITHNKIDMKTTTYSTCNKADAPKDVINRELDGLKLVTYTMKADMKP
jgi:hypothetical protein